MIRIGIYCKDSQHKREIKESLKQYFSEIKIELETSNIRAKTALLKNLTERYMIYNIVLSCEDDRISYIKRNVIDHIKNYSNMTVGWLSMPLSDDRIDEIIFNDDFHGCPRGIYKLATRKTVRAITHGDIEFCRWNQDKTVIFLKGDETEEVEKSAIVLMLKLYFLN